MILQHLRNFEWLNEPNGVFFIDAGMKVVASGQNFFFTTQNEDFSLIIKWSNITKIASTENGIMLRIDDDNYAKCYVSYDKDFNSKLYCKICNLTNQDISMIDIEKEPYLQIKKTKYSYKISYSYNLETFENIREFSLVKKPEEIQIGAYLENTQISDFEATLSYINLK